MLATLKDRCLFWLRPLPLSSIAHTKQRRTSAFWPYYCRREKAHRISLLAVKPPYRFHRQSNDHSARTTTSTYISKFLAQQHITCISLFACFGSPKFLHDQTLQFSNKQRAAAFFCVWSRLLERTLCQFQSEHCVEKERRLNIFWIREKMHPATDESAAYAFGRFVTTRIQPPASLSLSNHFMNGYLQTSWAYCGHHIN